VVPGLDVDFVQKLRVRFLLGASYASLAEHTTNSSVTAPRLCIQTKTKHSLFRLDTPAKRKIDSANLNTADGVHINLFVIKTHALAAQ
jgi:hypothetical protein